MEDREARGPITLGEHLAMVKGQVVGQVQFRAGERQVPNYYRTVAPCERISPDADVIDVSQAFGLTPSMHLALKYMVRAGRKQGESVAKDLNKALECVQRELMHARFREGKS